jgi:hypothetical protein
MKFGLEWTKAVIDWYTKIYKYNVTDISGGFNPLRQIGGVIITATALLIAIVGFIVAVVVDTVAEIGKWIGGIINPTNDDDARDVISKSNCEQLNAFSDDRLVSLINDMLNGFTGDEDENSILKLLTCLPCARLRTIVVRVGLNELNSEINGSEKDELLLLLGNCGIIDFSSWNDDVTRLYIGRASCAQLNTLSVQSLRKLFINLFEDSTGDEDEQAINKVMNCLECSKIRQILNTDGTRWSDFDDEIQGSEWTDFKNILGGRCGIRG